MEGTLNLNRGIYISLDEIFDTRYGVLYNFDQDLIEFLIKNKKYKHRLYDEFDYVNNNVFTYIYSNRNKSDLIVSKRSNIIEFLAAELSLLETKRREANEHPIVDIDINVYPYDLTKEEKDKIKKVISFFMLSKYVQVNFIDKKLSELTLNYIDKKYSLMFMYEYHEWLDYQILNKTGAAPTTKLYIPALLGKPIKVKKIADLENMFNSYAEVFKPYIDMTHIPVELFCILGE